MRTWGVTGIGALALCVWSSTGVAQQSTPVAPAAAPTPLEAWPSPAEPAPPAPPVETFAPAPAAELVAPPAAPAPASQPARVPLARRWWFWAGLGAAAVGVVIAGIMLSPPQAYAGNAEPGITSPF